MKQLCAILVCALAGASCSTGQDYEDISIDDLKEAIEEKKVVILDVNGSKSYSKGHIPGAIDFRAHEKEIAKHLGEDKSKLVVAYCGGPSCSAYMAAIDKVKELGFTNVVHFSPGISGWIGAGEETGRIEKKKSKS